MLSYKVDFNQAISFIAYPEIHLKIKKSFTSFLTSYQETSH